MQVQWNPLQIALHAPEQTRVERYRMGTARSPSGEEIFASSRSLWRGGRPWLPVMGEFHYSRYPASEWRSELSKIRAGGVTIISTYVFWIHHEEAQGEWDWSERRNLREFVRLCGELDLLVMARIGPWAHGEVRNGGFPDWLVKGVPGLRTDAPGYLEQTRRFYFQISRQIEGLLWKDGGPVIGVQFENEYRGPAAHLLSLKRIAIELGIDVPLYTRTGWPELSTPMPPGELLPLFGGYPDGFWDRSTEEMPTGYRGAFLFTKTRADGAIATDLLGLREVSESPEDIVYPYFACEIGGGMERSYHRRIRIAPDDIAALSLVKLGSGNNLQGYYMYHGGTNPDGRLSTLQESQATGYWNDVPVKSYDFQAPIGEFGQVRPHYHSLRLMHMFLGDFGHCIAVMPSFIPEQRPSNADDTVTLRWAARTDGRSGYLFINNYQRLQAMPPKQSVQFHLCLTQGCCKVPLEPVAIPANTATIWPFHMDLAGLDLVYTTSQPICRLDIDDDPVFVFAETQGISAEFLFKADGWSVGETTGEVCAVGDRLHVRDVRTGLGAAIVLRHADGRRRRVVLLDREQSLSAWKLTLLGEERLFLTSASLTMDGVDGIRLRDDDSEALSLSIFPAPDKVMVNGSVVEGVGEGMFRRYAAPIVVHEPLIARWEQARSVGLARMTPIGSQGVAEAPTDADFEHAAVWRVRLPETASKHESLRLRFRYVGDVARVTLDGKLLTDNFYNGDAFELGLSRYGQEVYRGELLLQILPLRKDAPIYLARDAWPEFDGSESVAELLGIEIIQEHEAGFAVAMEQPVRTHSDA